LKKSKGNQDDEKRSLLQYEGGMDMAEGMEMEKKMEEKMEEKKEDEEPVDDTHCCCKYPTALLIYGIFLWILGLLVLFNILIEFANIYFPWYYPFVSLLLVLVFSGGLVLIAIWMCKESPETRTGLKFAGWLILGSVIALILWNVFYILNHNKHKHEGVKVGTGDDPDDYDEEDRSSYLLGYLIWGIVIIVLDVLFLCCAINYADSFPPEDEMMDMMEEKMMDEPMMDAEMGMEAMMEGGAVERRSALSRSSKRSRASRSSSKSVKSVKSNKSMSKAKAPFHIKNQAATKALRNQAFNEIDAEHTPRGSMKESMEYEQGSNSQIIEFNEDPQDVPKIEKSKEADKKNKRKANKWFKKNM